MKKFFAALFFTAVMLSLSAVCFAQDIVPCIFVNGNMLACGSDFAVSGGRVYGKAQRLSEIFGYTLSTDDYGFVHSFSDNTRTVTYDSYAGTVNIGDRHSFAYQISDSAYVPYEEDNSGASFIPLRMLCEAFGMPIEYDVEKNEIYITKNDYQKGLDNPSGVAIVWKNGKYGLMNSENTLIMNCRYDDINNYDNPLLFKATENHRYGLIDTKGNLITNVEYSGITYVSESEIYLEKGRLKGMCDIQGNIVIPVAYNDIVYCGNMIAMVKPDNRWCLYFCSTGAFGEKSYDNVYKITAGVQTDNIYIKGYYVEKNGMWGYIDSFGNVIIDLKYEALDKFDENGRARMIQNGKVGIIDCGGKVLIPPVYDYVAPFGNLEITVAQVGNKYGAIDKNGDVAIPFEYDYIYPFNDMPSAICYKNGRFAVLSTDNTLLTDFKYSYAEEFNAGMALVYDNGYGFVDHRGNEIVECVHDEIRQGSALSMFLKSNGRWALFSSFGKNLTGFIYESAGPFSNGLSAVGISAGNKTLYGYVNDSGDMIIPHIYDSAQDFDYGKAIVSQNGKYGIVDVEGNVIIPFEYMGFNPSYDHNLIAAASANGNWGIISFDNSTVLGFNYDYVFEFQNGFAPVLKSGMYAAVNTDGKFVVAFDYKTAQEALDAAMNKK